MTAIKILNLAKKQMYNNYLKYCKAYGKNTSWCQIFLWWLLSFKGHLNYIKDTYARKAEKWCSEHYKKVTMKTARAGDIVFFKNDRGIVNHCGLIRKKGTSKKCYTIEGNVGIPGKWKRNVVSIRTREKERVKSIYRPPYNNK